MACFYPVLGVDVEECLADDRLRESAGGYSFDCTWWRASHQTCYGRRYVSGCCACEAARRCYGQGQLTSLKAGAGATVWCETDERRYHVCSLVDNHSAWSNYLIAPAAGYRCCGRIKCA